MDQHVYVFPEPPLEFRYGQTMVDPHDGLTVFGPFDADMPSHPRNISYGVIGTPSGINTFRQWCHLIQSPIYTEPELENRIWPVFPGFEAAFASSLPPEASRIIELDEQQLVLDSRNGDQYKRVAAVVEHYLTGIERIIKRDDPVDVVICLVPDVIYRNCRPQSRIMAPVGDIPSARELRQRKYGQLSLFDKFDPEIYKFSVDFRRQIKARAMKYNVPTQIIRESTIRLASEQTFADRRLTPLSDRAWNLGVALYYKAGGKPWRLSTARNGVCYIGIAYRREDPTSSGRTACCAAQLFLDTGDGIVFIGEYGPWYSPERNDFHLTHDAARNLLQGVLSTYKELEGQPLREIFLHCRSGLNSEEFNGFQDACPKDVHLVGIRVRKEPFGVRLFREGSYPVLRGTFWRINPRTGYLWANGFKPRLGTYDGWEVPIPLRIDIQHGEAELEQVAYDILGLTKLNYNACRLGEGEPVTIRFSDAVGEILVSNPTISLRSPKFKFYI